MQRESCPAEVSCARPGARRWTRYWLVVGVVLFGGLVWFFGWRDIRDELVSARPVSLAWMALLIVAGFWIRAWKWRYALGPGRNAIGLFFLAKTAGNWSPARLGELSPLLLRRHRTVRIAAWILFDRVVEVAATLGLGVAGVAGLRLLPWPGVVSLAGAGVLGTGLALGLVCRVDVVKPFEARWPPGSMRHRLVLLLAQLRNEIQLLGSKTPGIVLVTLLAKATDIYAVILLCQAFGYDVSFLLVCVARCAHALVSGIPVTPDATGVPFVAAAVLLHQHGGVPYETLTAALGLEVAAINLFLWLSFVVGAWDLRSPRY